MEIRKIGVLGCGLMGSGIAQVAATAAFDVTVLEVEQKYLDKGFSAIRKSLENSPRRAPYRSRRMPSSRGLGVQRAKRTWPIAISW
jgi:3-hydroxybutyryl-CoA dehydrogenase